MTTVSDLKGYINEELRTGRGIAVTYSNGARMPTDKYAEMLARTTRTETQNIAMLGKALDDGNDLVECSTISPTCPTCAIYQGRIYSISGNTPGYPALYKTAFRNGYSCIHPNCRHQFFPYNPKFHTEAERKALEEDTRRPMDEEKQGDNARSAYARSQMQMRQWNKEINEFAKMQEHYGDNAQYKNLGAFRRAYRSEEGSLAYAKTHYYRRDERELEGIRNVLGTEKAPQSLAKLQSLKYNKNSAEYALLRREKATISDIKSKGWTSSFKQKAIDTYYEFREDGIELTDHGIARLLQRFENEKELIKIVCNEPFNYYQDDGKRIKHYKSIAVIYAKDTEEVVSFIDRTNPKEGWHAINN